MAARTTLYRYEFLLSGNIPEQERDALGYPAQLWITNNSSASLRLLYQQQKN